MPRQSYKPVHTPEEWKRLGDEALAALIVTGERAAWIAATYPESDMGRPGLLHTTPRGEKRKRVLQPDAPVAVDGKPEPWRATFGFEGNESGLELAEAAAD